MTEQPLSLQWLCFIRDHGLDLKVTQGERALASLLPTYGQGKKIYVTMKSPGPRPPGGPAPPSSSTATA